MKPENLLLLDHGPRSLVKVCDFGLSKMVMAPPSHRAHARAERARAAVAPASADCHTNDKDRRLVMKSAVGTRVYAAPEIMSGADDYDQSIDLWGLGLIMFLMLSGRHPFEVGIRRRLDLSEEERARGHVVALVG